MGEGGGGKREGWARQKKREREARWREEKV